MAKAPKGPSLDEAMVNLRASVAEVETQRDDALVRLRYEESICLSIANAIRALAAAGHKQEGGE